MSYVVEAVWAVAAVGGAVATLVTFGQWPAVAVLSAVALLRAVPVLSRASWL